MIINGSLYIGTGDNFIVIGPRIVRARRPIADYEERANPNEFNKWICLSVHWNEPFAPGSASNVPSRVWCNGRKLTTFTPPISTRPISKAPFDIGGHSGSQRLGVRLNGEIALFIFNDNVITDNEIKLHHFVFCNYWFDIPHQPISII